VDLDLLDLFEDDPFVRDFFLDLVFLDRFDLVLPPLFLDFLDPRDFVLKLTLLPSFVVNETLVMLPQSLGFVHCQTVLRKYSLICELLLRVRPQSLLTLLIVVHQKQLLNQVN